MNENTYLVPLVELNGNEYLVDIKNRLLIDSNDFKNCIDMRSKKGRKMVDEMAGTEWHNFVVYPDKEDGMEV